MTNLDQQHLFRVFEAWSALRSRTSRSDPVVVTGDSMSIADVVAVALYGTPARLTDDPVVRGRMARSRDALAAQLAGGMVVYGVNTGFGGSADTRTQDHTRLQSALVQHLNVGLLLPTDKTDKGRPVAAKTTGTADLGLLLRSHAMPPAVVRAMMLIRSNSLAQGHSAVRDAVVDGLLHLLACRMTPVVPLRGSISASGDLSSLSYVAGLLEGNPDVHVHVEHPEHMEHPEHPEHREPGERAHTMPADEALCHAGIRPLRLQAKEGLGITNGTAASCAVGALAVHAANQLAVWVQVLTAMGTEALGGTASNYDPFISRARPHAGQAEAAANLCAFLAGSVLSPAHAPDRVGLAQDRYPLRTAPQWIGPQLEDLTLATRQMAVEINSTTDNPLIDAGDAGGDTDDGSRRAGTVHHGGNFQAMSVTSAMEKTAMVLQNLGRLLYAQSSELIDHARNRGLPPNLSADDPSTSFVCKGFDVNMAAYQAELAYLAKPVSSHVQVAEMANQSVNSMALVAARYALEATEIVSMMAATYIFVLCQGLDLRCMQHLFHTRTGDAVRQKLHEVFALDGAQADAMAPGIVAQLLGRWDDNAHKDLDGRAADSLSETVGTILDAAAHAGLAVSIDGLARFRNEMRAGMIDAYQTLRHQFQSQRAPASRFLSPATRVVYEFVRVDLGIAMHRGIDDHPTLAKTVRDGGNGPGTRILGTMASEIYVALRDGRMFDRIMAFCEEAEPWKTEDKQRS